MLVLNKLAVGILLTPCGLAQMWAVTKGSMMIVAVARQWWLEKRERLTDSGGQERVGVEAPQLELELKTQN